MPDLETIRAYAGQLAALLPSGPAWPRNRDSKLVALLEALAVEAARVDERGGELLSEMTPDTTFEMLPDWELAAGLPDYCDDVVETISQRRDALLARLRSLGGQSPAYFVALAETFGFAISVTEYRPFRAGMSCAGDGLTNGDWVFTWQINAPSETVFPFRAGLGVAGEPLATWGNSRLECLMERFRPAHTLLIFTYSD